MTQFKNTSEYIISFILLVAAFRLYQNREKFETSVYRLLIICIILTIGAELAFTFYISVYGFSNLVGHFFKVISFYLIYKALVQTGLKKPYDLLFRDLKRSENALRASQEKLRATFESLVDGCFAVTDLNGNLIVVNDAFVSMHGYNEKADIFEKSAFILIKGTDHTKAMESLKITLDKGYTKNIEYTSVRKDGSDFPVEVSTSVIKDSNDNPIGIVAIVKDITERKQAEESRRRLLALEQEQSNLTKTLIEATNLLHSIPDIKLGFQNLLEKLSSVLDYDSATLTLFSNGGYEIVAHQGFHREALLPAEYLDLPHIKKIIELHHAAIIPDTTIDPGWLHRSTGEQDKRCWLGVPLIYQDQIIGILNLDKNEPESYTQHHADLALTFANQAAIAIETARLHEQTRQDAEIKSTLLKEIHHRVKNNLQLISSLLSLQSRYVQDPQIAEAYRESENRIRTMALIHENLYQSSDLVNIDIGSFARDVVQHLRQIYYNKVKEVSLSVQADDIFLGVDQAIPVGLITNELVTNALKYAFPDDQSGEVNVKIQLEEGGQVTITFSDNGIGLPEDLDFLNPSTLGLQLVINLIHQLEGAINVNREQGTEFSITFMMENGAQQ